MQYCSLLILCCVCILMNTSCRKTDNAESRQQVNLTLQDTTTVKKIEGRIDQPGNPILFVYNFYYDANYRIKQSVMLQYDYFVNQFDTSFFREYFYTGNDSMPYKFIYGNNEIVGPGSFIRDTAFLFYDATNWLVKDSGTINQYVGYGPRTYAKRKKLINYITADSFLVSINTVPISGGNSATNSFMYVKNTETSTQKIQKAYTINGTLSHTYTTAYDTYKNPLAKALLQVHPFYDFNALTLGDGAYGLHFPQPFNRVYFSDQFGPNYSYSRRDSFAISYNNKNLPVEIIEKHILSTTPKIKMTLFY
jgi:hypothetical protein